MDFQHDGGRIAPVLEDFIQQLVKLHSPKYEPINRSFKVMATLLAKSGVLLLKTSEPAFTAYSRDISLLRKFEASTLQVEFLLHQEIIQLRPEHVSGFTHRPNEFACLFVWEYVAIPYHVAFHSTSLSFSAILCEQVGAF